MPASRIVPFQWPRLVETLADCEFYHSIELPEYGLQEGFWDLRSGVDAYLGGLGFEGRRVLDVGAGSGFLSFEMEKRGAQVISFDFDAGLVDRQHDVIPYGDFEARFGKSYDDFFRELLAGLDRMKNSYWLSHRMFRSAVRVVYGDIYAPPGRETFGDVDVVFFGNVLLHLQNPLKALDVFASQAREQVVVTENSMGIEDEDTPLAHLRAGGDDPRNFGTWWQFTPGFFKSYLRVLGFRDFEVTHHDQRWAQSDRSIPHFTVVATR